MGDLGLIPCEQLDDLLLTDDDASGAFALDELLGDGADSLLSADDFDDDSLSELVESAAVGRA